LSGKPGSFLGTGFLLFLGLLYILAGVKKMMAITGEGDCEGGEDDKCGD
jgi:hypothetical protein